MSMRARPSVTIEMVAAEAGVSRTTVSFVLCNNPTISESTRARVMRAVKELGFQPSSSALNLSLSGRRHSRCICVLVPELGRVFEDPYFSQALCGIYDQLEASDYRLLIRKTSLDFVKEKEYLNLFRRSEVSGMLYVGSTHFDSYLEDLAAAKLPFVLVNSRLAGVPIPNARADNITAGRLMTSHLVALGHRKIATITGGLYTTSAGERLEGYQSALKEAGIPFDEDLVIEGNFDPRQAAETALALYRRESRPTAIYVHNDAMAVGVLEAFERERIKVPNQIAIVGTDNIQLARYCRPPLTTVETDTFNVARTATRMLLEIVEGEATENSRPYRTLPVHTVIRQSCGASPAPTQETPPPTKPPSATRDFPHQENI